MASELRRLRGNYTIGQLCREFQTTPRALRFYEEVGLLSPQRQGLNRIYSYRDRARLDLTLRGKRVGLSLAEVREILELYGKGDGEAAQNAYALRKFRERIAAFEQQRAEVEQAINELNTACAQLEAAIADAAARGVTPEPVAVAPARERQREYAFAR